MADGRPAGHPGHEGPRVRVRPRPAARGRVSTSLLVDTGVLGEPLVEPDVPREEVARAAGRRPCRARRCAGTAARRWRRWAAARRRCSCACTGRVAPTACSSLGGSGNSSVAARAMRDLPVGVPKLIVSTVASGDTRPYVGAVDITMTYSVVDISGINRISARILANAAGAIAGMATATVPQGAGDRPLVGATMFGVTTPCVTHARERLEELGYEVLVFHATGTGGQSFEALATGGFLAGALDATTTELADDLVGGVLSAGPDRLEAVGRRGRSPRSSPSARWTWSTSARATPSPSASRTATSSCTTRRSRSCARPPRRWPSSGGASPASSARRPGRPRSTSRCAACPPSTSTARRSATRRPTRRSSARCARAWTPSKVELVEVDADVNDPAFATAMADRLHELIGAARREAVRGAGGPARAGRRRAADHRRGRRHRALGEVRRGGRRGPHHHLQLRPLPDGGPRLARRG